MLLHATRALAFLALLRAGSALACGCPVVGFDETTAQWADAVFDGELVGISEFCLPQPIGRCFGGYTVRVNRVWKGLVLRTVHVISDAGSCTFPLDVGKTYVIFATGGHGLSLSPFETAQCTGTVELKRAPLDVSVLGEPHAPSRFDLWIPLGLGTLVFGAGFIWLRRRRLVKSPHVRFERD